MKEGFKERIFRAFTVALVLLVLVGGLVVARPSYMRSRALKRRSQEMSSLIEAKKQDIAVLLENQRRFKTDRDFVEAIARKNGRVLPGELVFIFADR